MRHKQQGGSLRREPLHSVCHREGVCCMQRPCTSSPPVYPFSLTYAMNITTESPATIDGDVAVGYVLVPFLFITIVGIVAAVVMYIRRKRRIDRLRHQLLPVYTYDPSEELNEAEQEMLWREEDTRIVQGWARGYQQRRPLLTKDVNA